MKFLTALLCFIGLTVSGCSSMSFDQRMADKVVHITNSQGSSCSGEMVRASSGASYILTAAHCKPLAEKGLYRVRTERGAVYSLPMVAEDEASDLLLIQGIPGSVGFDIAPVSYRGQKIITFTHGSALNTYRTDGILIQERNAMVGMWPISDSESEEACRSMPKYKIMSSWFGPFCVMDVPFAYSTAFTAPGSSGGPIVNEDGELIGVVSAGGGGYSLFVRLVDIKIFLSKY